MRIYGLSQVVEDLFSPVQYLKVTRKDIISTDVTLMPVLEKILNFVNSSKTYFTDNRTSVLLGRNIMHV